MPLQDSQGPQDPRQNRILAALTANDYSRLQDDLEPVSLKLGQVLYDSGDSLSHVYFPATCIVSLVFTTSKGSSAELAITGNDGLVGIPLVLGGETTTHRAVIQSAGTAYRLRMETMRWELDQDGELLRLALRYTQALMTQMAQSVVCNRHHSVDQQLCRWLLLSLDRLPGNQLNMTQELIGNMLGVRREAVTEAAGKLQAAGLIHYSRGHITIIDRPGIEARSCECYAVVKREYDRLFQLSPAIRSKGRSRPNPETLRQRAETRLRQSDAAPPKTHWDYVQLVHELQVHQIELEMHNEELRHAYDEADTLRDRYADIYDFAPVGYFTLDRHGVIIDMNLAGSILLGVKGSQKGRHRFAAHVAPDDLAAFNSYCAGVLQARHKMQCELALLPSTHRPASWVRIEGVPDENCEECRLVVLDITAKKAQEAELERLACIDSQTGLATRAHFLNHMEQALSALRRSVERDVAVLMIALDDFPAINEALGLPASDAFLHLFAALLRGELRQVDFAGRLDGERFVVLLPGDPAAALIFAERLQKKVAGMSLNIAGRQAPVTLSMGSPQNSEKIVR
jgi:diguanylate cyclase (GGDEF)-like protein